MAAGGGSTGKVSDRLERASKIAPQLTQGPLVRVVGARHETEAQFIQGLLLEEGVPSVLRRSAGYDVPDMLAAGPRDVLVAASAVPAARDLLLQAELIDPHAEARLAAAPGRLLAGVLAAVAVVALVIWALWQLVG
jgi:hypothetical protein